MTSPQPTPIASTSAAGATATSPDWLVSLILMANEITAATELMSSPYLKGAVGHIVPILEAVQKMTRNREDFQELCEIIVKFVNILFETISRHGIATRPGAQRICEELERLLQEIRQKLTKQKKGLRHRLKEFGKSTSISDELARYNAQLKKLRTDFILMSVAQLNINAIEPITQPPLVPVITVCPPPSRIFHGRRDILDKMHHYFAQDVGKRHVCLLYGLGGSGKTQIALKFLDETPSDRFTNVFFLDAGSIDTIQAGLKNIALTRSIGSDSKDALHWLASCQEEWMVIFDNADDPKLDLSHFFPQSTHGNILITSRNPQLQVYAPDAHHRISDLEQEAAVQLLLASALQPTTSDTEKLAIEIVKVLHCSPLAVAQAGAFIAKTGALQKYLVLYGHNSARLLSYAPSQSHDKYAWSVYTTWNISFQNLSQQAAKFLQLCSFLHYEGISETIFLKAATFVPYPLGPTDEQVNQPLQFLGQFLTPAGLWEPLCFHDITMELQAYSLIDKDPTTQLFSIHPLVHNWSRTTVLDINLTRECAAALLAMSVSQEDELFNTRLLPHINTVLQADPQLAIKFLYPYCRVYQESGNFQRAQELCEQLVENVRFTLGAEHPDTLTAMAYLATIYQHLGRLADAEELQVVVLERRRQILGSEHPDTLTVMVNLANTYQSLGKLADAEEMKVVVLEKQRQTLGPDHRDTLATMGHLAITYQHLGKWADAEELEVVVLEKQKHILGYEHPDTLTTMADLAITYEHLGKLVDAEELQVALLETRRQLLGPEHPDTLTAMENLANTYRGLGKLTDAEELQVVVLDKRRQALGTEHHDTLTAMAHLAVTYWGLGRLTDAEQLQVVVLEKTEQTLGPDNPYTLSAMANLVSIYRGLGKLADAEALELTVLDTLGPTLKAMGYPSATYWGHEKSKNADTATVAIDPLFTAPPPEIPEMAAPQKGSTFVIYTPKDMDSPLDMPTGTTTALRPDDVEILKNEFPDGGTISSVHSPDKAVFWVEAHYEDQLLKSMRSHGIGGPIASMLSPDIPALTIFGSFLDKSVVQAAQLLADGSRFMVMLRPTMDDPVPKWEQNPVADYSMIDALDEHPGHFVSGDNHNKDSQPAHEETIDSDNSSTTGAGQTDSAKKIGMALRLRGGADEDECSPWLGPIHKSALNITVCPGVGVTHDIWLLSQIQFKLQTEYTDSRRSKPRPQLVSWTRFSSKSESRGVRTDRSYSASGFVVYGHSIFDCESIPCADFTPPNQTTKVTNINTDQNTYTANIVGGVNSIGGLAYAKNKIKTNAVENMNDRVTPKCAVYAGQGNRWNAKKENDASFNSMIFSYQPASIFQEDDQQHPMEVEFSMGITTMSSGIPESASFIARNQTNLWIPNNQLRAKGQGMVVASSAYIPDIHAIRPLNIEENTTVELAGSSLTNLPAAKKTSEYDAALSLSIGLLDQKHPNDKPGFLRKLTNKLSDISLSRRNPIPNASIETVRLHEYIARGWDASLDQWRLPIYPTLDRNFRPGATSSWKLEVTDERGKVLVDPEYKGPRPAPLNRAGEKALQAPGVSAGPLQLGTATTSQISFVTGESSAGSGTVPSVISTQATSIEVAASSPRATSISGQVTAAHDVTTKAGPSSSKGKGKAPEISQT